MIPPTVATFAMFVNTAASSLWLPPVTVTVSEARKWAAWVEYGPGASPSTVFVNPAFLREAPTPALRVVAYHEVCHLYIGNNRRQYHPNEEALVHEMVSGCIRWLLGHEYHFVMTTMPCTKWFPNEALYYNRLIGKERCR